MILLARKIWADLSSLQKKECLARPRTGRDAELTGQVKKILQEVKDQGDQAVIDYTRQFDCEDLGQLMVREEEFLAALAEIDAPMKTAVDSAIARIRAYHAPQMPKDLKVETAPGVVCEKRYLPIEKVGLYIPGGTAPLPSTLMMLAIPALIAGCEDVVLTTPPQKDGSIHPVILAVAAKLNIRRVYKCGGAQAIAALAYGTATIPKVDKIFGPGNAWVTEAKMQVALDPEGAAIDLPAGPSEVLVVADDQASPVFVAADLLSQAEHDRSSQVILLSTSAKLLDDVELEMKKQLTELPRQEIAASALKSSRAILVRNVDEAMEVSNLYAPEHLILQVKAPAEAAALVKHAGSVFLGKWSPESVGDYASGTNHVLPTYGFARAFSGVDVMSFLKSVSFQQLSREGLLGIATVVETLAAAEGLEAHRLAVTKRVEFLRQGGAP